MSVTGLCGVCERAEAKYVCDRCGTPVCDDHFDREYNMCQSCATQVKESRRNQSPSSGKSEHGDGSWHG